MPLSICSGGSYAQSCETLGSNFTLHNSNYFITVIGLLPTQLTDLYVFPHKAIDLFWHAFIMFIQSFLISALSWSMSGWIQSLSKEAWVWHGKSWIPASPSKSKHHVHTHSSTRSYLGASMPRKLEEIHTDENMWEHECWKYISGNFPEVENNY